MGGTHTNTKKHQAKKKETGSQGDVLAEEKEDLQGGGGGGGGGGGCGGGGGGGGVSSSLSKRLRYRLEWWVKEDPQTFAKYKENLYMFRA